MIHEHEAIKAIESMTKICTKAGINFVMSFQLADKTLGLAQSGTRTALLSHIGRLDCMAKNTDEDSYAIAQDMWANVYTEEVLIKEGDKDEITDEQMELWEDGKKEWLERCKKLDRMAAESWRLARTTLIGGA